MPDQKDPLGILGDSTKQQKDPLGILTGDPVKKKEVGGFGSLVGGAVWAWCSSREPHAGERQRREVFAGVLVSLWVAFTCASNSSKVPVKQPAVT
jgi:hypothetical protein